MEKTVFRRENRGENHDGEAIAATAVRTRHDDHDRVRLDGFVAPGETPKAQADRAHSFIDRLLKEYCDGSIDDLILTRYYVREDLLPDAEFDIGESAREFFEAPDLPATVMVGVSDVVGGDHAFKMEAEAVIPHEREETQVVELPPPPGYVNSADRTE